MCAPTSNIWIDCLERERQNVRPHSVLEPVRPSHLCETNKPTFVDYSSSDSSASKNDNGSDDDEDEKSSNGAEEDKDVAAAAERRSEHLVDFAFPD